MLTHIFFLLIGALIHATFTAMTRERQETVDDVLSRLRTAKAQRLLEEEDEAWHKRFEDEMDSIEFEPEDWDADIQEDNEVRFGAPRSVFDEGPEEFELIDIEGFKLAQEDPAFNQSYSEWKSGR